MSLKEMPKLCLPDLKRKLLTVREAMLGAKTTARFFDVIRLMVLSETRCKSSTSFLKNKRFKGGSNRERSCNAVSRFLKETLPSISRKNKVYIDDVNVYTIKKLPNDISGN